MTTILHTGDTHIGYRQYHSPERRQDFLRAFDQVISDAIAADVNAVVHAGDLFHDTRPDLPDLIDTIGILQELNEADIPFLAIVGNHEGTRDRQWLDLFADLGLAERLDAEGTQIGDVTCYGLDYIPPSQRDRLSYEFAPPETPYAALVAHGLFEPFAHAEWETDALLDSATVDFDVLLLGDNHTPDQATVKDTWVTYCGSTERASTAEREERGYNLVSFEDEVRISRRTIPETRDFVFVDVDLQGEEGSNRVIEEALAHDITEAVVVITITGAGEPIAPAEVEAAVADSGALVVRVNDERELTEDDTVPDVHFAEPDRAVDEHLRTIRLSGSAELVDAIVRDQSVPDSTVRDRVRNRIETLLAEEPAAFERTESAALENEQPSKDSPEIESESDSGTERAASDGDDGGAGSDDREDQLSIGEFT